jgi:hypothetical protein
MLAAILRASSRVSSLAADRRPGRYTQEVAYKEESHDGMVLPETSIAGVQIPNWGIVLGAVIVIFFIYSAFIAQLKHAACSSTDQGGG